MLLAQEPQLLLVDEPVAGMTDAETEQTAELLREINRTRSVVVVEHDMAFVRALGVKVTVLHEGSVLSEGSHRPRQRRPAGHRSVSGALGTCSKSKTSILHYGAAIALRQVSLQAEIGAVTCLLGRNGVGKTSLLRAITGAHPIDIGNINWEGEDITRLPTYERARRGIAWVPQGRDVFPLLTVRENLETGFAVLPRGQRRVPDEIFELFPILKTMLRRRGGDLSGGQQQQLAIARALVTKPRLLVLDEPTEGIQPSIIKDIGRVIALLRSAARWPSCWSSSISISPRNWPRPSSVMDRGDVVLAGTREELDEADVRRRLSV